MVPSYTEVKPFTIEGDDAKFHKAKWHSMLKDCAHYYDVPTLEEEGDMRR
jgi:hypothetical protein